MITVSLNKDATLVATLNEGVQNLHVRLHPELFKPHSLSAMEKSIAGFLADPSCYCYVAWDKDKPVGYAIFLLREIAENAFHFARRSLYIDQICVLESHQKSGVGKLLLQQADILAKELNIDYIQLDHWSSNTVAANFFRKNGFKLVREYLGKQVL